MYEFVVITRYQRQAHPDVYLHLLQDEADDVEVLVLYGNLQRSEQRIRLGALEEPEAWTQSRQDIVVLERIVLDEVAVFPVSGERHEMAFGLLLWLLGSSYLDHVEGVIRAVCVDRLHHSLVVVGDGLSTGVCALSYSYSIEC